MLLHTHKTYWQFSPYEYNSCNTHIKFYLSKLMSLNFAATVAE